VRNKGLADRVLDLGAKLELQTPDAIRETHFFMTRAQEIRKEVLFQLYAARKCLARPR